MWSLIDFLQSLEISNVAAALDSHFWFVVVVLGVFVYIKSQNLQADEHHQQSYILAWFVAICMDYWLAKLIEEVYAHYASMDQQTRVTKLLFLQLESQCNGQDIDQHCPMYHSTMFFWSAAATTIAAGLLSFGLLPISDDESAPAGFFARDATSELQRRRLFYAAIIVRNCFFIFVFALAAVIVAEAHVQWPSPPLLQRPHVPHQVVTLLMAPVAAIGVGKILDRYLRSP